MWGCARIRERLATLTAGDDSARSPLCTVRHDRLEFSSTFGLKPPTLSGFVPAKIKPYVLLRRINSSPAYTQLTRLYNPSSGTSASIRFRPTGTLLAPLKTTLIANDATGLTAPELREIVEAFDGKHRITSAEFAFDFHPNAGIDVSFVRRFGLFGKSRPKKDPQFPNQQRYGSRKSRRFVRCYWKKELGIFRVEVQISSRWYRESNKCDRTMWGLAALPIFPNDLFFARFDWEALDTFLTRFGPRYRIVFDEAKKRSGSIHKLLHYLRVEAGIGTADRFLRPLKINIEIARAWRSWARDFTFTTSNRSK
jgi:hypothetical protein